jgi:hypothetical protein
MAARLGHRLQQKRAQFVGKLWELAGVELTQSSRKIDGI